MVTPRKLQQVFRNGNVPLIAISQLEPPFRMVDISLRPSHLSILENLDGREIGYNAIVW